MKHLNLMAAAAIVLSLFASCTKERSINEPGNLVPKTVDQDPSLPAISVNGARLHSEAFGNPNDPIILVIHGGPASDYRYLLNCKEFASHGYRVVFYDQRGTGLSQRFPKSHYQRIDQSYDDINAVINYYKTSPGQKVFLLGHSWGAMLAGAYLNKYPTPGPSHPTISGAVLGEPGGLIWKDVEDYVKASRKMRITSEELNNATYMDQFITGKRDEHAILDYKYALLTTGEADNVGNEADLPFWRSGAVLQDAYFDIGDKEQPNWTTNLRQYTTKVLFIYSERNKSYGLAHAQKVSSAFPNVTLFKTMGAGHDMLSFPTGWQNTFPTMLNYFNSLR